MGWSVVSTSDSPSKLNITNHHCYSFGMNRAEISRGKEVECDLYASSNILVRKASAAHCKASTADTVHLIGSRE